MKGFICLLLLFLTFLLNSRSKKEDVTDPSTGDSNSAFVLVDAGSFFMGDSSFGQYTQCVPVHKVNLSSYYIGKYEVTQAEWNKVMTSNPSIQTGDKLPVSRILWLDAIDYCNKRSQSEGLNQCYTVSSSGVICNFSANGYRLPTEAEWEYAARGGKYSHNYKYSGSNDPLEVAWYNANSEGQIHEVGQKKANELGIFDMSGNVIEWCWDVYSSYKSNEVTDPSGPDGHIVDGIPASRIARGGKYDYDTLPLNVSWRYSVNPTDNYYKIGLRLVKR